MLTVVQYILSIWGGKFRSESHRKEFDNLNEEALKMAQNNLQKKEQKELMGQYKNPSKYGGLITVKGMQNIEDQEHARLGRSWLRTNTSDYSAGSSIFFGNFGQKEKEDKGAVEIDARHLPLDDSEPEHKNKIEESIWRIKNNK